MITFKTQLSKRLMSPSSQVFAGAIGALAAMTVLSALMGYAAPALISKTYTHYAATALFLLFGLRMLWDAAKDSHAGESELDEVEKELAGGRKDAEPGKAVTALLRRFVSPILLEAFTLTFVAEWGDRSQIATIGLAAASDVVGVTVGGIVGHAICTGAAVLGGKHLATHIDERVVGFVGGILFLLFAAHSAWTGPE